MWSWLSKWRHGKSWVHFYDTVVSCGAKVKAGSLFTLDESLKVSSVNGPFIKRDHPR
jgi:hypothetical protein